MGIGLNDLQWVKWLPRETGRQEGNVHSWRHHLPTQSPELKETGKAPAQARHQVKLWLQASALRVWGACKKEGGKRKRGVGESSIYTPKDSQGWVRLSAQKSLSVQCSLEPAWGSGRSRAGRARKGGWAGLRVPVPAGWAGEEGGGSFRLTHLPPCSCSPSPPCPPPLPPFSRSGFKP